jgi:small GTP-binding protein
MRHNVRGGFKAKFKVVFVGDTRVGKTSLIHSYLKQSIDVTSTLGATSTRIEVSVPSSTVVLIVWDTAGQETLRNLVPVYAKGSQVAVIVFDQAEPKSYEHVAGWYDYIIQNVGEIVIVLAANKSDLPSRVDFNDVFQWAGNLSVDVTRTSAKDGTNVDALFEGIAEKLAATAKAAKVDEPLPPPVKLEDDAPATQDKPQEQQMGGGSCC